MRFDITKLTLAADQLLLTTTKPLHRAILLNYRRHAILEVCGYYEEIFAAEMAVETPKYKIFGGAVPDGYYAPEGTDVRDMYKGLVDHQTCVMMVTDETLLVNDWGFAWAGDCIRSNQVEVINSEGDLIDDLDAVYIESRHQAMFWPYDNRGRMISRHVYTAPLATVRKCPPEELLTLSDVREALMPLINDPEMLAAAWRTAAASSAAADAADATAYREM